MLYNDILRRRRFGLRVPFSIALYVLITLIPIMVKANISGLVTIFIIYCILTITAIVIYYDSMRRGHSVEYILIIVIFTFVILIFTFKLYITPKYYGIKSYRNLYAPELPLEVIKLLSVHGDLYDWKNTHAYFKHKYLPELLNKKALNDTDFRSCLPAESIRITDKGTIQPDKSLLNVRCKHCNGRLLYIIFYDVSGRTVKDFEVTIHLDDYL